MTEAWTHREGRVNGVRLHWVEQGEGPLVVLLHGFPEFWYAWRHQVPALAAAGFRAVAPDLRGYNLSDKPRGVAAYRIEALLATTGRPHRAARRQKEARARRRPRLGRRPRVVRCRSFTRSGCSPLALLNAPHPLAFRRELKTNRRAAEEVPLRFLLPAAVAPRAADSRRGTSRSSRGCFGATRVRPGAFTDEDILLLQGGPREARRPHGRRQLLPGRAPLPAAVAGSVGRSSLRTLLVWGERDRYLGPGLLEGLDALGPGPPDRAAPGREPLGAGRRARARQRAPHPVPRRSVHARDEVDEPALDVGRDELHAHLVADVEALDAVARPCPRRAAGRSAPTSPSSDAPVTTASNRSPIRFWRSSAAADLRTWRSTLFGVVLLLGAVAREARELAVPVGVRPPASAAFRRRCVMRSG